jgi:hypothetical protein
MMNDDLVKLGVLWKNISRNGQKPYLSGRVEPDNIDDAMRLLREGGRFLVLSNKKRPDKKDPDCILFVAPERPAAADGAGPAASSATARPQSAARSVRR